MSRIALLMAGKPDAATSKTAGLRKNGGSRDQRDISSDHQTTALLALSIHSNSCPGVMVPACGKLIVSRRFKRFFICTRQLWRSELEKEQGKTRENTRTETHTHIVDESRFLHSTVGESREHPSIVALIGKTREHSSIVMREPESARR